MSKRTALFALIGGMLVLAAAWLLVLPNGVSPIEEGMFRALNDLPGWIRYPGWPAMQLGSILAVALVASGCFLITRNSRLATLVAVAGTGAWVLARVAKELAQRGRPASLLDQVEIRSAASGLGFPSGHAAVAAAMALVLFTAVGPRVRAGLFGLAILVGLLRIYFGVHLPFDVLGGWALGITVGAAVEMVGSRPPAVRHDRA